MALMPRPIRVISFYPNLKPYTVARAEEYRPLEPSDFGDPPIRNSDVPGGSKDGAQISPRGKLNC